MQLKPAPAAPGSAPRSDAPSARTLELAAAEQRPRQRRVRAPDAQRRPEGVALVGRALAAAPAVDAVAAKVAAMAATVLGSPVSNDQPLMAAGLDSLGAVELRNALAAAFGTELPPTVTLDYPTVSALAGYITQLVMRDTSAAMPADTILEAADEDVLEVEVRCMQHALALCS